MTIRTSWRRGAQYFLPLALMLCSVSVGRAQVQFPFTDFHNDPLASTAGTQVTGINNSGQIVGYFLDFFGHKQGFLLSGGSFSTIHAPGAFNTLVNAVNAAGQMVGSFSDALGNSHGFLFSGGTFTTIDPPGASFSQVVAINDSGQTAGNFDDALGNSHGFLLSGGSYATIDPPGGTDFIKVTAMNASGQVVGWFDDANYNVNRRYHSFLFSAGSFTTIDYGYHGAAVAAINDSGQMAGTYDDAAGHSHGFLLSGGSFTTIDPVFTTSYHGVAVTGMNAFGQIVGSFGGEDVNGSSHGFLYSRGTSTEIELQGGINALFYAINDSGQMAGLFFDPNLINPFRPWLAEHIFLASNLITLLDPVPNLLDGPAVTTDSGLLSAPFIAHQVSGVSADGVAQIVVKIAAPVAGEQYTLTLMNDSNSQSNSPDEDGALGSLGASTFSQSQVAVTAADTVNGPMAFAIYRAPVDFARPLNTSDEVAASRSVSIQVVDSVTGITTTAPVKIVRPPIALIHGLWSDKSTWEEFADTLNSNNLFDIYRVNYESTNFVRMLINERKALTQLGDFLEQFKLAQGVAAVQFDLIGHSMGGLISRDMLEDSRFYLDSNYKQGWIQKLITIDTPHAGSIMPKLLDQSGYLCHVIFASAGMVIDGATNDLEPNSFFLRSMYSLPLPPTHAIAGHMTITQEVAASLVVNGALALTSAGPVYVCPTVFLAVVPFSFAGIYGEFNDVAVGQSSQIFGFTPGVTADVVPGVVHLHVAPFPWLVQWADVPPGALDAASGNTGLVLNLLNTPPSDAAFKRGIQ